MYKDVYFTEPYQNLFAKTEFGGEPQLFEAFNIEYRFYQRPIGGTPYFDIVSPYGYSGPVAIHVDADWQKFYEIFHCYCEEEKIVAEFARLHPFISLPLVQPAVHYERDVYWIDLTKSKEEIWDGFDKGCKSAVKRGEAPYWYDNELKRFRKIYNYKMQLKGADEYIFDDEFFNRLAKIEGMQSFVEAVDSAAGIVLLKHGDYCHYFLSASTEPNRTNFLLWAAIRWAKEQGCKVFNLGGGLQKGDTLESFKRSFSQLKQPFYTYRKIHLPEVYMELCNDKGIEPGANTYFPAYRRA